MALISRYLYVLIAGFLIASHVYVFHKGITTQQARDNKAQLKEREAQDKKIAELEALKPQREIVYRDRIKIVKEAIDECLDKPLPPGLLPDEYQAFSRVDRRLWPAGNGSYYLPLTGDP